MRGGGAGANLHAIVYEPQLTLGLPVPETVGTSLNALAHCAEALYVRERTPETDADALAGAELIGDWLPRVVERPGRPRGARRSSSAAPVTPAPRSAARCSRSATRSRRRSAAATARRTAR